MRRISPAAPLLVALLAACVRTPPSPPAPVAVEAPALPPEAAPVPVAGPDDDEGYLRARALMVPVEGVSPERIPDTFAAPRAGSRIHRATDILAPRGTPVLSADDGRVLRVSRNRAGGLTVYATDDGERLVYYYAHLDRYADGIEEGTKLAKGMVIGYVGTTGNAPKDTPHLHFQVMRREPQKRYWEGTPLDARPFLAEIGRKR
jgi:murein DD-endopeptidase MepM/ murein hydrolase activator NlpD